MSKISSKPITCPSCNYKGEFKMYESVNVSLDPSLREKVLSGKIFEWICPKCGENLSIRYNLLYHDMDKSFQVYYSPQNCSGINKMINDMLTKYPGMRKICRTTDTLNGLIEKIYIFESGLNDIAIELSKVIMKYDKNNEISEKCELRFEKYIHNESDNKNGKLIFRQIIDNIPQKELIVFDRINYDNYLNEVLTNEKYVMSSYCDTIDEKWIIDRMI